MQTRPTIEPTGSPVPGVIPAPLGVPHETVAADEHASRAPMPASLPGRRDPASIAHAKLLSAIRGDKYMADAYPPAWHPAAAVRAGVAVEPDATAVTPQAKER